jgi:antitoxin ParD1/3/4
MNVPLTPQDEALIKRKVESGLYGSTSEAIARALELLDQSDQELAGELAQVRATVKEGTDQLKRGKYVECTDETLDELLEQLEAKALSDLERSRPSAD